MSSLGFSTGSGRGFNRHVGGNAFAAAAFYLYKTSGVAHAAVGWRRGFACGEPSAGNSMHNSPCNLPMLGAERNLDRRRSNVSHFRRGRTVGTLRKRLPEESDCQVPQFGAWRESVESAGDRAQAKATAGGQVLVAALADTDLAIKFPVGAGERRELRLRRAHISGVNRCQRGREKSNRGLPYNSLHERFAILSAPVPHAADIGTRGVALPHWPSLAPGEGCSNEVSSVV